MFSIFGFININSLCLSGFFYSLNEKIGPIRQPDSLVPNFLKEKKIVRTDASYVKEKGLITSLLFGNRADIVCNKYKFLIVLFSSFSKNIMLILMTSCILFGFAIICSYMLTILEDPQYDITLKIPYWSYIYQTIYQYKEHDIFNPFFAYELNFYFIAVLNIYLIIFSTRSIFVYPYVYDSKKDVQCNDIRTLFNRIELSQDVFLDKGLAHKIYSQPDFTKQSYNYLFETHPRALNSKNTFFICPMLASFFHWFISLFFVFCCLFLHPLIRSQVLLVFFGNHVLFYFFLGLPLGTTKFSNVIVITLSFIAILYIYQYCQ